MTLREYIPTNTGFGEEYGNMIGGRDFLWGSKMKIPNVRNRHGVLCRPGPNYASEIPNQTPVSFDVILRL